MDYKKLFRTLLYLQIFFFVISLVAYLFPSEDVKTFNEFIANKSIISDQLIIVVGFLDLILVIISWIFILQFKKIGRDLFLIVILVEILWELLSGPIAYTNLTIVTQNIRLLLSGAILVISHHSPLSKEFI